jgi:type IV pilus assembly protein PilZ
VQEQRRHFRKPTDLPLEFQVGDGPRKPGVCRDFSLGGMHIYASEPAPFGANVTVHIRLGDGPAPSALPGIVRWVKEGSMGIQFGLLGARETYAITEMLAKG